MTLQLPMAVSGERFEFTSAAGRLSAYVAGRGPPLLLIHSTNASASAAEMRPLHEHYRATRTVFSVDLPGYGFSDRSDRNYTPRLMTDAVHAFTERIHARCGSVPLDALALSLSCEYLARAATEAPDRYRSVALVSPTGFKGLRPWRGAPGSTRGLPWLYKALRGPGGRWGGAVFRALTRPGVIRYFLRRTWGSKQIDEALWAYDLLTTKAPGAEYAPLHFLSANLFSADINTVYERLEMPVWMSHGVRGDFTDYRGKVIVEARPNWKFSVFPTGAAVLRGAARLLYRLRQVPRHCCAINPFQRYFVIVRSVQPRPLCVQATAGWNACPRSKSMASEPAPVARIDESLVQRDEPSALISAVTYRSRAVAPMSELDLHRLARAAQRRNSAEGVTGLMVYDRGWIFQQLEGPTDGLARIWGSIRRDRRHASIEVLSEGPADQRDFLDWNLKLSVRGAQAGLGQHGMPDEPPEMISRLCRGERPVDLQGVSWPADVEKQVPLVVASEALLRSRTALSELIATVIVPRLCAARAVSVDPPPSLSASLASLLIAVDASSAFALVEAVQYRYVSLGSLATDLLEPAARDLGDLWQSDDCTEIEVTLGLGRLQAIAREFGLGTPRLRALHPPVVLVAPQPGEAHMLGAILDAEMLWQAGWSPRVDFPSSSSALDSLVASTWIDALDLSLSTSFQRDHRLAQLGKTIASARLASLNPDVVVVVSGRVFSDLAKTSESAATGRRIGADGTFGSAALAQSAILQALRRSRGGQHFGSDK